VSSDAADIHALRTSLLRNPDQPESKAELVKIADEEAKHLMSH
jgi:hypothetical protein